MKTHFLIIAITCLFLQSEARSFRGGISKFLGINQDADDIADGYPTNHEPGYTGDTPHARAGSKAIAKTAAIIQREISNGLRTDFQFLRDSITAFADDDGFVREGIVFCGGKTVDKPSTGYHLDTGSLNQVDGFGNELTDIEDGDACGRGDKDVECEEGSFVSLLANRIRALGYHVTHPDICMAHASTALAASEVPIARTCKLSRNVHKRQVRACKKEQYEEGNDFFQVNQECYKANAKTACELITAVIGTDSKCVDSSTTPATTTAGVAASACNSTLDANLTFTAASANYDVAMKKCTFDEQEDICIADYTYMDNICSNGKTKDGEDIAEDDAGIINSVRRVIAYSVKFPGDVPLTDKTYVTGVKANAIGNPNGCKSLRQYVAALNGMSQINAFRDVNIEEADANWAETIKEARTYIESYASILDDFYDQSLLIFPAIEFEEMKECPIGDVEKSGKDDGTIEAPLCDNTNYQTRDSLNAMTSSAQALLRSKCFCRKGSMGPNAVSAANKYEADMFYLSIEEKGGANNCTTYKDLPSVYQFCTHGNMEAKRWKDALQDLEPSESHIKTFGANAVANQRKIYLAMQQTLPLISQDYKPNCGRLVSADATEMMYSNKGGNCVPFAKMNDLLYRLEFETSQVESGTMRDTTPSTFADTLCKKSDKLASTMYTFRQLAYQWDHTRMQDTALSTSPTSPTLSTTLSDWDTSGQNYDAQSFTDQMFKFGNKRMCNIDWTEEIAGETSRKDAGGDVYSDPYLLFDREIKEAIFNADIAIQAKKKTAAANENLWSAIEAELTSVDPDRINTKIATEAAEHFMRIVTTDSNDPDVDSDDAAADFNAGGTETPTPFDVCSLDQKASSSTGCTNCTGSRVITVGATFASTTIAAKESEKRSKRSAPSSTWDGTTDTNTAACSACAVDDQYVDSTDVCVACVGIGEKVAYTSGNCTVGQCASNERFATSTVTCHACPGDTTNSAGNHAECNIPTSYTGILNNAGDLFANIADVASGKQQFNFSLGNISGSETIHNYDGLDKVCRTFAKFEAPCESGFANGQTGAIAAVDLLYGQTDSCEFDITNTSAIESQQNTHLSGDAVNCLAMPTPLNNPTSVPALSDFNVITNDKAVGGVGIIIVRDDLDNVPTMKIAAGNYTDIASDNHWQLMELIALGDAKTPDALLDAPALSGGDDTSANQVFQTAYQASQLSFQTALDEYKEAYDNFKSDYTDLIAARDAISTDINVVKTAVVCASGSSCEAAPAKYTELNSSFFDTQSAFSAMDDFGEEAQSNYLYGEIDPDYIANTHVYELQKVYRVALITLDAEIMHYQEAQQDIKDEATKFATTCTVVVNNKVEFAEDKIAEGCDSANTTALTTALSNLGVQQSVSFNATEEWDFTTGSGETLKNKRAALIAVQTVVFAQYSTGVFGNSATTRPDWTPSDPATLAEILDVTRFATITVGTYGQTRN